MFSDFNVSEWIAIGGVLTTVIMSAAHLSFRFGRLEERVRLEFDAVRERYQELRDSIVDIEKGQSITCARHNGRLTHLEQVALKLEEEVNHTKERLRIMETGMGGV